MIAECHVLAFALHGSEINMMLVLRNANSLALGRACRPPSPPLKLTRFTVMLLTTVLL